ncbi:MAG: hypothetical protein OXD46_12650 [Chloroflexi bacterium]|nr:hypothetical protein [Chloroflexota bacterium]
MTQYDPFEEFEESFRAALDFLTGESGDDETLSTLTFVEDAAENAGVDDYVPDWLSPYVSIAGQLMLNQMGELPDEADEASLSRFMTALVPAMAHAVRLGYAEGYEAGKTEANGESG